MLPLVHIRYVAEKKGVCRGQIRMSRTNSYVADKFVYGGVKKHSQRIFTVIKQLITENYCKIQLIFTGKSVKKTFFTGKIFSEENFTEPLYAV